MLLLLPFGTEAGVRRNGTQGRTLSIMGIGQILGNKIELTYIELSIPYRYSIRSAQISIYEMDPSQWTQD